MRHVLGACLALIVAASVATTNAQPAAVTAAPTWKVGDQWTYSTGNVSRVVAMDGEMFVTEATIDRYCAACRISRNSNWIPIKAVDKDGKSIEYALIGFQLLDFPLSVGKEWSQEMRLPLLSGDGWQNFRNRFKVEKFEEVKTKAGTFKAYRINWYQESLGSYRWNGQSDMWWSPDTRSFVKRKVYTKGFGDEFELVSFTLGKE